jgi:hypothetical protein
MIKTYAQTDVVNDHIVRAPFAEQFDFLLLGNHSGVIAKVRHVDKFCTCTKVAADREGGNKRCTKGGLVELKRESTGSGGALQAK